jgi:N6-L-threonylcarbamoyladenine synthase
MLTLGVDTTFQKTSIAVSDNQNRVLGFYSRDIDIKDHDANRFFSTHLNNLLVLLTKIKKDQWPKIELIAVTNEKGAFHSIPIGVSMAAALGFARGIKTIGIDHEISHLYANWIDRQDKDFHFPIASLSVSGGHSAIYLMRSHLSIEKIMNINFRYEQGLSTGIGALFDYLCHLLDIGISQYGAGGIVLSSLAAKGKMIEWPSLKDITIVEKDENVDISGFSEAVKNLNFRFDPKLKSRVSRNDLAYTILSFIFKLIGDILIKNAKTKKIKEIHLAGGVAASPLLNLITRQCALSAKLDFKSPLDKNYCGDNSAMVAVCGRYQAKYNKVKSNSIEIKPSDWYYHYYFKNHLR